MENKKIEVQVIVTTLQGYVLDYVNVSRETLPTVEERYHVLQEIALDTAFDAVKTHKEIMVTATLFVDGMEIDSVTVQ